VAGAAAVLLAVPIMTAVSLLPEIDGAATSAGFIMDTGSAKRRIVDEMGKLPGAPRMIGGHPLAGSEVSGPANADPDLFQNRPWTLSRNHRTDDAAAQQAMDLVMTLGACPVQVDAGTHDRSLARTSHLPQLIASALALSTRNDAALSGPAYAAMTRLAGSDTTMWRDILTANRDQILSALDEFESVLDRLRADLSRDDFDAVGAVLERARKERSVPV